MGGDRFRGWRWVLAAVLLLGVASLLSNITTVAQLSGDDRTLLTVRRTVSLLLNAGTAWAGVSVLAGWLVRRPGEAALAGLVAGSGALVVHYGLGELTGLMPPGSFADNAFWFAAAVVTGVPLGLAGAMARRAGPWGWLARLVVPVGALLEPWASGWWAPSALEGPAVCTSSIAAAMLLTALGVTGAGLVLRRATQAQPVRQP